MRLFAGNGGAEFKAELKSTTRSGEADLTRQETLLREAKAELEKLRS